MSGIFGPGECIDQNLNQVIGIISLPNGLINSAAFTNPQNQSILTLFSSHANLADRALAFQTLIGPLSPLYPKATLFVNIMKHEGDLYQAIQNYQIWTNFLSGKSPNFPFGGTALDFIFNKSNRPMLSNAVYGIVGLSFLGAVGMAVGATRIDYVRCQTDSQNPCNRVNSLFAPILGAFDAVMSSIFTGLGLMTDFLNHIDDYLAQVASFVQQIVDIIAQGINTLIDAFLTSIRYGLAKMFGGLVNDPCFGQVLGSICGPDLKVALGL